MRVFMNRVIVSGYLTADPQLLRPESGGSVCRLRIGCHSRRMDRESGRWREKPNFFDVTVFGDRGETVARLMRKGASIAVDGRLDWREWRRRDGRRAQGVSIIADTVHFMEQAPGEPGRAGEDPAGGDAREPVRAAGPAERGPLAATGDDWLRLSAPPDLQGVEDLDLFDAEQAEPSRGADGAG